MAKRVVVTGLGVVSPLGCSLSTFWARLLGGKSGISALTGKEFDHIPSRVAGLVNPSELSHSKVNFSKTSRSALYSVDAADQAFIDANFFPNKLEDTTNIGVIMGCGMIDLQDVYSQWDIMKAKGYKKVSPWFIPKILPNNAAGAIALKYKINGLIHCISTACATGAHAIGDAYRILKCGELDAILVGGVDSSVDPLTVAGFSKMRALSTLDNNNPEAASKPFDQTRNGFVLAEGSAALLLETEEHALKRNRSKIYAEISGYGYSSDAYHISAPSEDGKGAILSMTRALSAASIRPENVGYISAHSTSTPLGDVVEAHAISEVFNGNIPLISATKGATGHLLGAAGAIESISAILAVSTNTIPGTTGLKEFDKSLPKEFAEKLLGHGETRTFPKNKSCDKRIALKNSFGFFGANASLCFSQYM